ncbi:RNA-guided endonuclease TnpB family protein [Methanotorris formicicus]|uniref:Transposase, IS605 OrfB family n=1 Tax=Methanotorris formicicus Mc-S-70 TaxID=647171 RepID=H1L185_9EURY|nr:RNA-guided endonuclease TnpB family protein [Methanotorris formicicus]EHP83985.1 transposase, IS605 OrfB family [Methanotorris formicicus Mc-S-70]
MSNKTKSKNNQELSYQIVLSYKVRHNYPIKTFLIECRDKLNECIDIIWKNIEYIKKDIPKLPKSNEFKRNLRNELLENWNYASHYIDGIIKTAYSILESWASNYKKGYRTKTKPIVKRLFVRVKTTLIKYDKEKGIIRITIKPRKDYLTLNIKDEWFFDKVRDLTIGEIILKENEAFLTFKDNLNYSDKEIIVGVDCNLKSLDIFHPIEGWIRIDLTELHRIKEVYDKKIDGLKKLIKKCPLRALRKIERLFERRKNRVKDFLHKLTTQLSRMFPDAIFVVEDLNKRGMYKNKLFNRKIDRANWSGIIEKISYKTIVILVNPAYTSTTCPICGSKMESQEGQVVYCSNCLNSFNRQLVGCLNIFKRGLGKIKKIMGGSGVTTTGAEVSFGKLMTSNPNVEAKLPVRKSNRRFELQNPKDFVQTEGFPLMVYSVDYNGKYLIKVS